MSRDAANQSQSAPNAINGNAGLYKGIALTTALGAIAFFLPNGAVDPWNLIAPQKIAKLVLALMVFQIAAEILSKLLGARSGTFLTGFIGGLISSTALTASLSRQSMTATAGQNSMHSLAFLGGTLAMLTEALGVLAIATSEFNHRILLVVGGPFAMTLGLIALTAKRSRAKAEPPRDGFHIELAPILKLTAFIVGILAVSKSLQATFGDSGLGVLTFLVSLFEIHGSIIANVQLHEANSIPFSFLGQLIALSIAASYVSKLILVALLAKRDFKYEVFRNVGWILVSLALGWISFHFST